jgi:DNA-binding NarL/FixJ family response regulator
MTQGDTPIRILLADPLGLFREALRTVLEREQDLRVVGEARSGPEAVAEIERSLPNVAIVEMDLPITGAAGTTTLIKDRLPSCRVLVLGTAEDSRRLTEVLDAGASGYVTKESPLAELIDATRAVHRGNTLIPPGMLGPLLTTLLRRERELEGPHARIARLTRREREVLALLADGGDNDSIARTLMIKPQTARTHIQNILSKLSVHSRLEAAAFVTQNAIMPTLVTADGARRPSRSPRPLERSA